MKKLLIVALALSLNIVFAAGVRAPLPTVNYVDLDRYSGTWYEIARFDHSFQRGCSATEATYTRVGNEVRVENVCKIGGPNGKTKKALGRAWVVDRDSNSKLKVQFFLRRFRIPWLAGDYWILDLDKDYTTALIGAPDRKYLWILSRDKNIDERVYLDLVQKAENLGFDTSKLQITAH